MDEVCCRNVTAINCISKLFSLTMGTEFFYGGTVAGAWR